MLRFILSPLSALALLAATAFAGNSISSSRLSLSKKAGEAEIEAFKSKRPGVDVKVY